MNISPDSTILICRNVPFNVSYSDTLSFSTPRIQESYYINRAKYTLNNYTYQRKDNSIKVEIPIYNLYDCNYIAYRNTSFENKWFYAFINNVEYVNNSVTLITYEIDVMQTWMFDYQLMPCFVEREHVNSDLIGEHLIDEGFALGEFITSSKTKMLFTDFWVVVAAIVDMSDPEFPPLPGKSYGNVYQGATLFAYDLPSEGLPDDQLMRDLRDLAEAGKSNAIISIYMIPKQLAGNTNPGQIINDTEVGLKWNSWRNVPSIRELDGYSPKNQKLLSYPFRSLNVTNQTGSSITLHYERWLDVNQPWFEWNGTLGPDGAIVMAPVGYDYTDQNNYQNLNHTITISGYPQCSWQNNAYSQWLAQQQIRWGYQQDRNIIQNVQEATNYGLSLIGLKKLNPLSMATDAISQGISQQYRQQLINMSIREEKEIHSIMPTEIRGGVANATNNFSTENFGFAFEERTIRSEVAEVLDRYLDMFGYRVKNVKIPNISGRPNWNYIQTLGCKIRGSFPQVFINAIQNIYDQGITFWHNPSTFGDYTQSNPAANVPEPPPVPPDPPDPPEETMSMPLNGPWTVTSEFGPRDYPPDPYHTGIDFATPVGTPLLAVLSGSVIESVDDTEGFGNRIVVDVGDGLTVMYAHMSTRAVNVGDTVVQGQQIGLSGNTGLTTGPHLHFETRTNNTPVNPRLYLPPF